MLEDGSRDLCKRNYEPCCTPAPAGAGAGEGDGEREREQVCCQCAHKRRASPLTCLAICFLVLTYNLLGGFIFLALEGAVGEESVAASMPNLSQPQGTDLRSRTVERLWSITEDLNILYKENWTKLAAKELLDFQRVLLKSVRAATDRHPVPDLDPHYRWTFSTSFLYALTLITTIGQCGPGPRSAAGRLVSVLYACVGVPLVLLYLSALGGALAAACRALYARVAPAEGEAVVDRCGGGADCKRVEDEKGKSERGAATPFTRALNLDTFPSRRPACRHAPVPLALSALLVALYVLLGAALFHRTERWGLLEGCYFSFSCLATIGFGDLRPGRGPAADAGVAACAAYILAGVVVVATAFNLAQDHALSFASRRHLAPPARLCAPRPRVHAHTHAPMS